MIPNNSNKEQNNFRPLYSKTTLFFSNFYHISHNPNIYTLLLHLHSLRFHLFLPPLAPRLSHGVIVTRTCHTYLNISWTTHFLNLCDYIHFHVFDNITSNPDNVHDILKTKFHNYSKGTPFFTLRQVI
ncbi:hypothetical protein AHAS_Ahas18G0191600 [Arachis hypogaea]